jgi:hypothetical protein
MAYAKKVLVKFKMADFKPMKTPMPRELYLCLTESSDEVGPDLQAST